MKAEVKRITPEVAKELLERNTRNRKFSKAYAKELAQDMREGTWKDTDQGIGIDTEGVLTNGQHRLSAIVLSGVPQTMVVVTGLPTDSYKFTDVGKRRNAADRILEDRQVADVASFILRITDGTNRVRVRRLEVVRDMVKEEALFIKDSIRYKQKPFGSQTARAAYVIAVQAMDADPEYAREQYDALAHYDFDRMSERSKNLVKRIAKGGFPAHTQWQRVELCYAIAACLTYQRGKTLNMSQDMIAVFVGKVKSRYGSVHAGKSA